YNRLKSCSLVHVSGGTNHTFHIKKGRNQARSYHLEGGERGRAGSPCAMQSNAGAKIHVSCHKILGVRALPMAIVVISRFISGFFRGAYRCRKPVTLAHSQYKQRQHRYHTKERQAGRQEAAATAHKTVLRHLVCALSGPEEMRRMEKCIERRN
ncbi:hypothetical protein HOY82DRAFT_564024, partial [Tuber indicum]